MTETVRERVAEVLGTRGFTDTDDLFEHGPDSLGVIRLSGAWRDNGFDVTFEDISAIPTVADWSAPLRQARTDPLRTGPATVRHQDEGEPFPLATTQRPLHLSPRRQQAVPALVNRVDPALAHNSGDWPNTP
ncbi:phosphopantetheine-binding protein [Nocardiopsis exhalans]|uniref:Phosphopantetheine-binding protein n=1 Tax=Nocardiopsis exhalans TaxID=163604 RepID=A0ABY5DEC3_9ACTN|nr:phosphopantetheine-binding protein [Nocardiopsis exhalans]USY22696.1 phosphopantetheine-binding protein [Nocardiopsis exhalans]